MLCRFIIRYITTYCERWPVGRRRYFRTRTFSSSSLSPPNQLSAPKSSARPAVCQSRLRPGEIANLTWDMVLEPSGQVNHHRAPRPCRQEERWSPDPSSHRSEPATGARPMAQIVRRHRPVIRSERNGFMTLLSRVVCPRISCDWALNRHAGPQLHVSDRILRRLGAKHAYGWVCYRAGR